MVFCRHTRDRTAQDQMTFLGCARSSWPIVVRMVHADTILFACGIDMARSIGQLICASQIDTESIWVDRGLGSIAHRAGPFRLSPQLMGCHSGSIRPAVQSHSSRPLCKEPARPEAPGPRAAGAKEEGLREAWGAAEAATLREKRGQGCRARRGSQLVAVRMFEVALVVRIAWTLSSQRVCVSIAGGAEGPTCCVGHLPCWGYRGLDVAGWEDVPLGDAPAWMWEHEAAAGWRPLAL